MSQTVDEQFERLSPRQRDCLRLVFDRKKSGQIASALGLSTGTVNGYVAEAIRTLGARDRVDAAERFAAWEAAREKPTPVQVQSVGVVEAEPPQPTTGNGSQTPWWRLAMPFRSKGSLDNELGIFARLFWIPIIAIAFAAGFGMLADALRVASDLVAGRGRL